MSNFKVITFDVEHGNCHVLRTPNDLAIMIDAGSKQDFSPASYLKQNWHVNSLEWLTITHQDSDHLTDISCISEHTPPRILERPSLTEDQLAKLYPDGFSAPLEVFLEFRRRYTTPVPPMSDPGYDWGGVQFATFNNELVDLENPNINDLSVITFAHFMGWTFIFPGDLERQGWLALMRAEEFRGWLGRVDIFFASHHGRESGFCEEIFEICTPKLTIISDKSSEETSVTEKYTQASRGLKMVGSSGRRETRYVLTTRNDGAIKVEIDGEGRYSIRGYSY